MTQRKKTAETAEGAPIPPSTLEQLMRNARITPILFNAPGRPLRCGRTRRTVNSAQLKALQLRDKGCIGCGAHPSICQAHHTTPWAQGGTTNLDNLTLVCYQCHHKIHDNNWQIILKNNKPTLQPPNPHNYN
ncbi:MAG: HNH endonuclease [Acidimicrobiaceae bacterium]|nr:HNH endonuclease [Acidimicrobiaceae bacterium]